MWETQRRTGGFLQTSEQMFYTVKYTPRLSATLPGFHLFSNDTMAILNKKPTGIHNEWAQPNSFPWCEIVLSTSNHWWLCNDRKHPHAFLIDPASLKAKKSVSASDYPRWETGNNVSATLEMLMWTAGRDSAMAVNITVCNKARAIRTGFVNEVTSAEPGFIIQLSQWIMMQHICIFSQL